MKPPQSPPVKLPDDLYSPDQLSVAILELDTYRNALHDTSVRASANPQKSLEPAEPTAMLASLAKAGDLDLTNTPALDALRKQLEALLKKAPVAHITLAATPNLTIKRRLTTWFREQISQDMLLTFAARADIGGGIVLQTGSHIYDFSFKRQLMANKQKIVEIAQRV